jgi:multidrug resistance protein, MATE family
MHGSITEKASDRTGRNLRNAWKSFLLAYPVMLSQLGQVSVGVADSVMVGKVGRESLAGASLGNSIFILFLAFGIGISYGITPLAAQADGERNVNKLADILKHGIFINTIIGILLFVLMLPFTFILGHLNQPEIVVKLSQPYLFVISLSIIPFMIFQAFRQFSEGLSLTRQAMVVTIAGNLMNIGLNYILIFGKYGFPALGLLGAGIATLISRIFMALIMAGYVRFAGRFREYWKLVKSFTIQSSLTRQILNIGLPSGMQFIFEVGAFSMAAIMMGWMGTVSLAAHQIAINLASLTYMMATGIAAATTIRVANEYGKKDIPSMRKVGLIGFIMSGSFMAFNAVLLILGRNFLPSLYINDPEVINLASWLIWVAAFFQLSDGIQVVGLGALRGMSDVKIPTIITLIAYWVLALPIGYISGIIFKLGPMGVWIGLWTGLTAAAVMLYIRFYKISKTIMNEKVYY